MKKNKKYIWAFRLFVLLLAAWFASDRIQLKLLVGTARILTNNQKLSVEVEGNKLDNVICFMDTGEFKDDNSERLVLWIDNPESHCQRVLIVDISKEQIILPANSSDDAYKLIFNKLLLQSESGACGLAFGNPKLDPKDPEYINDNGAISFNLPSVFNLPSGKWSIRLLDN